MIVGFPQVYKFVGISLLIPFIKESSYSLLQKLPWKSASKTCQLKDYDQFVGK